RNMDRFLGSKKVSNGLEVQPRPSGSKKRPESGDSDPPPSAERSANLKAQGRRASLARVPRRARWAWYNGLKQSEVSVALPVRAPRARPAGANGAEKMIQRQGTKLRPARRLALLAVWAAFAACAAGPAAAEVRLSAAVGFDGRIRPGL